MSKLDSSHIWSPSQLLTWEQSLREEYCDWESDKNRYEARYDKKVRLVIARENDALSWKKVLAERKSLLVELSNKEEDLYSEAYNFHQEYHCITRWVCFVCLFDLFIFPCSGLC